MNKNIKKLILTSLVTTSLLVPYFAPIHASASTTPSVSYQDTIGDGEVSTRHIEATHDGGSIIVGTSMETGSETAYCA